MTCRHQDWQVKLTTNKKKYIFYHVSLTVWGHAVFTAQPQTEARKSTCISNKPNPLVDKEWKVKHGLREMNLLPYLVLQWLRKSFCVNLVASSRGWFVKVQLESDLFRGICQESNTVSFVDQNKKHSWMHSEHQNKGQCNRSCQSQVSWKGTVVTSIWTVF